MNIITNYNYFIIIYWNYFTMVDDVKPKEGLQSYPKINKQSYTDLSPTGSRKYSKLIDRKLTTSDVVTTHTKQTKRSKLSQLETIDEDPKEAMEKLVWDDF